MPTYHSASPLRLGETLQLAPNATDPTFVKLTTLRSGDRVRLCSGQGVPHRYNGWWAVVRDVKFLRTSVELIGDPPSTLYVHARDIDRVERL